MRLRCRWCGVHLCLWLHQEYTFRCRTPAENRQEILTTEKRTYRATQNCGKTARGKRGGRWRQV